MQYVVIDKLSEMTGLTRQAIYAYRKKGIWREGIQFFKRNGRLYFKPKAIEAWIEGKVA